MSTPLLLETMRLQDGRIPLLSYHQDRMDRARRALYAKSPALKIAREMPGWELPAAGLHKLRVVYGTGVEEVSVSPYTIRPVHRLRVVHADGMDYGRKYADRSDIEELYAKRQDCDDVLIVKQGHLTDCSYANIALYDGRHWYTPAWPLLGGTRRAALVEQGVLRPTVIRLRDLHHFRELRLLNAMLPWAEGPTVAVTDIVTD